MNVLKEVKEPDDVFDTGIIVARFQVAELHEGQKDLINTVIERCDNVIIFLGLSPIPHSKNNPLDFGSRKAMIKSVFPNIEIAYIKDNKYDDEWSGFLDAQIADQVPRSHRVGLFGSRDSFINHYDGRHKCIELEADRIISGTEQRENISRKIINSKEFRSGQIFAAYGQFPTSYQTVDMIVYDEEKQRVLLGKKKTDKKHRFFGGFVDPSDDSLEEAALRELHEEAGVNLNTGPPRYLNSFRINDWRYRSEVDKIMTSVYQLDYLWGTPTPGDDIAEVQWFNINDVKANLVEEHHRIWESIELVNSKA